MASYIRRFEGRNARKTDAIARKIATHPWLRGTAGRWITHGKGTVKWTRLWCGGASRRGFSLAKARRKRQSQLRNLVIGWMSD
jgi:hypothetical protein